MSKDSRITLHATVDQKRQIKHQADENGESVSRFCLKAAEQRIARERQDEREAELGLETRLERLNDEFVSQMGSAVDPTTRQERLYEIALWELLTNDFSKEEQVEALERAPEKLDQGLEKLQNKESDD
jgi:uncharacterized protein (DUF1778 family)